MRYDALASASFPIATILVAGVIIALYTVLRLGKQRERARRRAARQAKRAEDERIWGERFGVK